MKAMKPKPAFDRAIAPEVEAYLASVPEPARTVLLRLRTIIRAAAPVESTEAISYAMPAFKYKGTLACYAAFTNHCSLFPMGNAAIQHFADELKDYATSKGTIRFPLDQPLPAELITKIIHARVAANENKKPASKKLTGPRQPRLEKPKL